MSTLIEPFYKVLGQRIQDLRLRRGMSQQQLGLLLLPRTTRASIGNIESGKQRVLSHTLVQIARVLDIGVDKLLPDEQRAGGGDTARPDADAVRRELKEKLRLSQKDLQRLTYQIGLTDRRRPNER